MIQTNFDLIAIIVGESFRILREFQDLSRNKLADIGGIPRSTISAIEKDRIGMDVDMLRSEDSSHFYLGGADCQALQNQVICPRNKNKRLAGAENIMRLTLFIRISVLLALTGCGRDEPKPEETTETEPAEAAPVASTPGSASPDYPTRVFLGDTHNHTGNSFELGIDVEETGHSATIRERVYSSPIWYTP